MISRFHKTYSRTTTPFIFLVIVLVVTGGLVFHQALFSFLSSVPAALTTITPDEYAGLPKNVLAAQLKDREQELARIRYQSLLYSNIIEENERLSDVLKIVKNEPATVGRVISEPPRTRYDTLLVQLQKGHDVHEGDTALFENIMLGTVERVSDTTALVTLYSSGGSSVDVRVGDPSGIVVLKGLGGGAFVFEIPQSSTIRSGDVITPAHLNTYAVAVVTRVVPDPNTTLATVYATLPVSFSDLRYISFMSRIREDI